MNKGPDGGGPSGNSGPGGAAGFCYKQSVLSVVVTGVSLNQHWAEQV